MGGGPTAGLSAHPPLRTLGQHRLVVGCCVLSRSLGSESAAGPLFPASGLLQGNSFSMGYPRDSVSLLHFCSLSTSFSKCLFPGRSERSYSSNGFMQSLVKIVRPVSGCVCVCSGLSDENRWCLWAFFPDLG